MFSIRCIFGNPGEMLSLQIRTCRNVEIKEMLRYQKQSTEGTKAVLLGTSTKDPPFIVIDINTQAQECLHHFVNSMLYHFRWDNTHNFQCEMLTRETLKRRNWIFSETKFWFRHALNGNGGTQKLWQKISSPPVVSSPWRTHKHFQKRWTLLEWIGQILIGSKASQMLLTWSCEVSRGLGIFPWYRNSSQLFT